MTLENKHSFSGSQPPTAGVSNKHEGESNPDMGEKMDHPLPVPGNKFPHETGTDSLTPEEAQLT
jgi:hypothetical protein